MNDRAQFDDPHLQSLLPRVPFTRRGFIASSLKKIVRSAHIARPSLARD